MIKRETVVSLLAGLLVGALGIAPVVAGDGFGFGPAQGGGGVTDAELLAIGALTPTDGNVIVGDGSTWVAESGATARASLGALGGSLGSTDNAIPRADGTGGVTLQGSSATISDGGTIASTSSVSAAGNVSATGGFVGAVSSDSDDEVDFGGGPVRTRAVTANWTVTTDLDSLGAGQAVTYVYTADASGPYQPTWPSSWHWVGSIPTVIVASKVLVVSLISTTNDESGVIASGAAEQ